MLSDLQTKKLTRYFRVYDIDDDGRIEAADFDRIVENVKLLHGESSAVNGLSRGYTDLWTRLSDGADGDGDGVVDLDEWLAFWQAALGEDTSYEREVHAVADRILGVFDLDEDGSIGPSEFADFYGVFGLSVGLADSVFAELDIDGNGMITRVELLDVIRQFYGGDDAEAAGNVLFGPYGD